MACDNETYVLFLFLPIEAHHTEGLSFNQFTSPDKFYEVAGDLTEMIH